MSNVESVNTKDLQMAVKAFLKRKNMSQAQFARTLAISTATVSKVVNGQMKTIDIKMLQKIARAVMEVGYKTITTDNQVAIHRTCQEAQQHNHMIAIIGDTGYGKSDGIDKYYNKTEKVYKVTMEKSIKPREFFQKLLQALGIVFEGSMNAMIGEIKSYLNDRPGSLIIIDEAGKLDPTLIMYLHDLRNGTKDTTGIILIGMPYLKTKFEKWLKRGKEGMAEFYRRIRWWEKLEAPNMEEIKAICEANGITDPHQIKDLCKTCGDFGTLENEIINLRTATQLELPTA